MAIYTAECSHGCHFPCKAAHVSKNVAEVLSADAFSAFEDAGLNDNKGIPKVVMLVNQATSESRNLKEAVLPLEHLIHLP
ncbi:hypothetical protein LOK49_LG09G02295 [Camellia lanceoleosa]|uniref:Uncharacterized protein n=1 Tax=Camellia lanceoleosa TaxID=1840588 RepID=A0ACC0GIL3_9ERIC|nr:hypothetical protein LOK49_LG09G02295 [Camellia lanceoleosa]